MVSSSESDLTLPPRWAWDAAGMSCDGQHTLGGVQFALDSEGLIVVVDPADGLVAHRVADAEADLPEIFSHVAEAQLPALRELLADLSDLRVDRFGGNLGDLYRQFGTYESTASPSRGFVDGGSFLFDIPEGVPAVWGQDLNVLWARGEPLMIAGPQGVGKTSDLGQLAFGLAGVPGFETLYGYEIAPLPDGLKVLYLALDRPAQIARALRRMAPPEHRALVAERLLVWQGPLPFDVVKVPQALADFALERSAGAVLVDSLKDVLSELSDEAAAARLNSAYQLCIAEGIEVASAHHNRKATSENKRPKSLADIHGSENLQRGHGSIISLYGVAGDTEIEFTHLKQAAETIGPLIVRRDHETGRSEIARSGVLETGTKADRVRGIRAHFLQAGGVGAVFTLDEIIEAGHGSENPVRKALDVLVADGILEKREGGGHGQKSTWTMLPLPEPGA